MQLKALATSTQPTTITAVTLVSTLTLGVAAVMEIDSLDGRMGSPHGHGLEPGQIL